MPTRLILFDHDGKQIEAEVYFSFEGFADAILITPIAEDELSDSMFFSISNKKWETNSPLKEKFPSAIKSIINCLNELFEIDEKGHLFVK